MGALAVCFGGTLSFGRTTVPAPRHGGDVFALDRNRSSFPGVLTAGEDCAVAWFRRDLVLHVCYRACWFHARLIQEIDRKLHEYE